MSGKVKLTIYLTKKQKARIKARAAELEKCSMGDYLWELVEQDLGIRFLEIPSQRENVN